MSARPLPARRSAILLLPALLLPLPGTRGQEVALPIGTPAPPATLEDLEGNPVQLLDFVEEGKPTLIEFWASWCEQCEALQPQMDQIQEEYGSRMNLVAVAVAVAQNQRRVRRHLDDHQPGYPYLWDAGGEAVRAYKAATTSIVVILNAQGRVAYTGVGGEQKLLEAVERTMGG